MPKELEEKLRRQAAAMGMTGEHANMYVYGGMRNAGWKPTQQKMEKDMQGKDMMTPSTNHRRK